MDEEQRPSTALHARPWERAFLDSLAQLGNVTGAAAAAGIDRTTAYLARQHHPEFAEAWDEALQRGVDSLVQEAWRRARDGIEHPVHYQGKRVDQVQEYSDRLLEFLLSAHRPATYGSRQEITHRGGLETTHHVAEADMERLAAIIEQHRLPAPQEDASDGP